MQTILTAGRFGPNGLAIRFFRNFASTADNVYELRLYQMKPERYRESLDLLKQHWPVRAAHSQDVGSWMTEIGPICETVHMWQYDGLGDRMARRQRVANDEVWRKEFLPKFFDMSRKLTCLLLKPRPGTAVTTSVEPSEKAVYELSNIKQDYFSLQPEQGETIIGQFETIFAKDGGEFVLYRYTDPDFALERAYKRRKDQKMEGSSRLLVPSEWSLLK